MMPTYGSNDFLLVMPTYDNGDFLLVIPTYDNGDFLLVTPTYDNGDFLLVMPTYGNGDFLLVMPTYDNGDFLFVMPTYGTGDWQQSLQAMFMHTSTVQCTYRISKSIQVCHMSNQTISIQVNWTFQVPVAGHYVGSIKCSLQCTRISFV